MQAESRTEDSPNVVHRKRAKRRDIGWHLEAGVGVECDGQGYRHERTIPQTFTGLLTYTPDGRVMALVTWGDREPLSNRLFATPAEERAEAYATSVSYAGTFTLNSRKVTHHVEASSIPNWVNTDLVRTITRLESNRVMLHSDGPFIWSDGVQYAYQELVWDRVK